MISAPCAVLMLTLYFKKGKQRELGCAKRNMEHSHTYTYPCWREMTNCQPL